MNERGVYCPNCGSKVVIEDNKGQCTDPRCGANIETEWNGNTLLVKYRQDSFELPPKNA